MATDTFTGQIDPAQVRAFVERRVGAEASRINATAETLRGLAQQLEALSDLPADAEPDALRMAAIGLGTIATTATLTASVLPGIGMALAVLGDLRQLGTPS